MWIIKVALNGPYPFIVLALLILIISTLVLNSNELSKKTSPPIIVPASNCL
jgi:hypothetical protein